MSLADRACERIFLSHKNGNTQEMINDQRKLRRNQVGLSSLSIS